MKKSFIAFWKDMWEAQKVTNACMKKHWKGYLVFSTACFAIGCAIPGVVTRVCDLIETKKEKSEEEES